jgi:hypothetical protein
MLERTGEECASTAATDLFLEPTIPSHVGGVLEMANARLYPFWGSRTEALRTGHAQNQAKTGEDYPAPGLQRPERRGVILESAQRHPADSALQIATLI